jgi:hypothetical protein
MLSSNFPAFSVINAHIEASAKTTEGQRDKQLCDITGSGYFQKVHCPVKRRICSCASLYMLYALKTYVVSDV